MPEISCGVVPFFITKGNKIKFLIVKHKNSKHWGFPKGHQEKNESFTDTAKREFQEETQSEILKFFSQYKYKEEYSFFKRSGSKIDKEVYYFLAQTKNKKVIIQKDELSDFFWGTKKEVKKKLKFKATKNILKNAVRLIKSITKN